MAALTMDRQMTTQVHYPDLTERNVAWK